MSIGRGIRDHVVQLSTQSKICELFKWLLLPGTATWEALLVLFGIVLKSVWVSQEGK